MSHFTLTTREMLSKMIKEGHSYRKIRLVIGKSISSISDEVKRNTGEKGYDPYIAHRKSEERRLNKIKRGKIEKSLGLEEYITQKIKEHWSPDSIAGELRIQAQGNTVISHETIYQFIYSKKGKKEKLWQYLKHKKYPVRKHWGSRRKRPIIPNRVSIHKRPRFIDTRETFGEYEGDLMVFSSSPKTLAVFTERKTRKIFVRLNENKTANEMEEAMNYLLCSAGICTVKSITFDNGLENICHEKVREDYCYSFNTYFCDSYCSWQKGSVENANKLLRFHFPRDIDPQLLTQDYLDTIVENINNRPRKILNYSSPYQSFISCSV